MPTTVVKTIGTASRQYSTIQAWEDTIPVNIITTDEIWRGECYNDSEFLLSTGVTFSGTTGDATRYIELTTGAGQSISDHASKNTNPLFYDASKGVGIRLNGSTDTSMIFCSVAVRLYMSKLQFKHDSNNTNANYLFYGSSIFFVESLVHCARGSAFVSINESLAATNCAFFFENADSSYVVTGSGLNATFRNCTFVADTATTNATVAYGSDESAAYVTLYNSAVLGFAAIITSFGDAGEITTETDYNATDLASGSVPNFGTNSFTSVTVADQIIDRASDMRPKSSGVLRANGVRDQTYTNDLDIFRRSRSTTAPSIGAYEAAGVVLTSPELISVGTTTATPRVTVDVP